jgi:CubicO group peptidase (beta-lactamase class C family)
MTAAIDASKNLPRLHSLLVDWRGQTIVERYYNGHGPNRLANIKSASKSVISALVGIAINQRLVSGVTQPIATFFPGLLQGGANADKREITIEDLLTMQSGLESTSNRNYGTWVQSRDWVRHALGRPMLVAPGTTMTYSTGNTHLLSAILTKVSGTSTWRFAQDVLATPLGFSLARWPQDPQGIYFGGNDMLMTPRQMVAFGRLYLNGGRLGARQIVPAEWVEASFVRRARSLREDDRFYGYGWWIRELAGREAYYAWGYGGQYIFLVPDLDLVVVTTSSSTVDEDRRAHRRTVFDVVENLIVAPLAVVSNAGAGAGAANHATR